MPKKVGKKTAAKSGDNDALLKKIEELEAIEDEDKIPKHACFFKLKFEIEHVDIDDYMVLMKFIDPNSEELV